MELPRPSLVKQLSLYLSPEGRGFAYLLADHTSGAVLRLSRAAAISFQRFSRAATGDAAARSQLTDEDTRTGFTTLQMSTQLRKTAQQGPPRFNPLFMHFEFFDVGPYQRHLTRAADLLFGPVGAGLFAALALLAFVLGVRNDWSAATAFKSSMSIEAFLTFGLFAPFLKLIHELGHVLAATKAGVRVRSGGVNLIAFFPLPFVDCSEADLIAQRSQRIMISAAGVLTDFAIGLTAFCLWHVVENKQTQDILGYIFVFSTLNLLLFNANPLMRLDGYFVASDALGRRNLGTDAAGIQKAAQAFLGSFGAKGALPQSRNDWLMLGYGIAAAIYKVLLLLGIMWVLLPQFFGIGIIAVLWGAWAMFGAKWMGLGPAKPAPTPPPSADAAQELPVSWWKANWPALRKWGLIGLFVGGFLMLPVSPRVIVDLQPDLQNTYNLATACAGVLLSDVPRHGDYLQGDAIVQLRSSNISSAVELAELGVAEAQIINAIAQGAGAAQIKAGADRIASAQTMLTIAQQEADALVVRARDSGFFTATAPLQAGTYLPQGTVIGAIVPPKGDIWLTGTFPEAHVIHFDRGVERARLWTGDSYRTIDTSEVALVEQVQQDAATLSRGFTLRLSVDSSDLNNYPKIRLDFPAIFIWQHIALWFNKKIAQFRDAQLAEAEKRIE